MALGLIIDALSKSARIALAAMLLVVVPLADAATCVGEEARAAIEIAVVADPAVSDGQVATESSHDVGDVGGEQHCIHGHCHHGVLYKASEHHGQLGDAPTRDVFLFGPGAALVRVVSGLERPPRA